MSVVQTLHEADLLATAEFSPFEEELIVSLAFDIPDYFLGIHGLLHPDMFAKPQTKYVINELIGYAQAHQVIPSRELFLDFIDRQLTVDHPYHYEIAQLVERPASYRDLPIVKERMDKWAKHRQLSKLYSVEGRTAWQRGDLDYATEVVEGMHRLSQIPYTAFELYSNYDQLFHENAIEHMNSGFKGLNKCFRNGGPAAGDVLVYMGPTNIGKSLFLCNTAVRHTQSDNGRGRGYDTLFVSFEMDTLSLAARMVGIITNRPHDLPSLRESQATIKPVLDKTFASHQARLWIVLLPADECSVITVDNVMEDLRRRHNFVPKSLILDYMDQMVSRRDADNNDDYTRQKYVAQQVRALGQKRKVLVTTATQTNRSAEGVLLKEGSGTGPITLDKAADSYGKTMPVDYVVTINRVDNAHQVTDPSKPNKTVTRNRLGLYIAKNRHGPKEKTIYCDINYNSMLATEVF